MEATIEAAEKAVIADIEAKRNAGKVSVSELLGVKDLGELSGGKKSTGGGTKKGASRRELSGFVKENFTGDVQREYLGVIEGIDDKTADRIWHEISLQGTQYRREEDVRARRLEYGEGLLDVIAKGIKEGNDGKFDGRLASTVANAELDSLTSIARKIIKSLGLEVNNTNEANAKLEIMTSESGKKYLIKVGAQAGSNMGARGFLEVIGGGLNSGGKKEASGIFGTPFEQERIKTQNSASQILSTLNADDLRSMGLVIDGDDEATANEVLKDLTSSLKVEQLIENSAGKDLKQVLIQAALERLKKRGFQEKAA
ncbi:MAG: hypothetical protein V1744_07370 [Candidatus Altiarchaeota archaeon]